MPTIRRRWRAWLLRRRVRRADHGERQAIRLVERAGYRVTAQQAVQHYEIYINGEPHRATVRADMLAERDGRLYVAEAKTGEAANPVAPATRRQLLEYEHAFGADGVLLADMQRGQLLSVEFGPADGEPT